MCVLPAGVVTRAAGTGGLGVSVPRVKVTSRGDSALDLARSLCLHSALPPTCYTLVLPCNGQKVNPGVLVPALCKHVAGMARGPHVRPAVDPRESCRG